MANVVYEGFDTDKAIEIHKIVFNYTEKLRGVSPPEIIVDRGKLDSVLHHIQNDEYYPSFINKLAHIVYGINKNHAFNNGNKRASLAISVFFLEINGHDEFVYNYQQGMEEVVVWVAKSLIEKETLESIIEFLLYEDPINIEYFIAQAKCYKPHIEPEHAPIDKILLTKMVNEWLSNEMCLSDATKFAILEVIDPEKLDKDQ